MHKSNQDVQRRHHWRGDSANQGPETRHTQCGLTMMLNAIASVLEKTKNPANLREHLNNADQRIPLQSKRKWQWCRTDYKLSPPAHKNKARESSGPPNDNKCGQADKASHNMRGLFITNKLDK